MTLSPLQRVRPRLHLEGKHDVHPDLEPARDEARRVAVAVHDGKAHPRRRTASDDAPVPRTEKRRTVRAQERTVFEAMSSHHGQSSMGSSAGGARSGARRAPPSGSPSRGSCRAGRRAPGRGFRSPSSCAAARRSQGGRQLTSCRQQRRDGPGRSRFPATTRVGIVECGSAPCRPPSPQVFRRGTSRTAGIELSSASLGKRSSRVPRASTMTRRGRESL